MEEEVIEIIVKTPSRLHFGIVDMRGDLGRIHGSVGVAIEWPNILLKASPAKEIRIKGVGAERIKMYAEELLKDSDVEVGAEFELIEDIPAHSGFGSGTQLSLAVGVALSEIYELKLSVEEIATKLKRSKVSGIGTYAFKHGGFIVDGGHRLDKPESVPPLVYRSNVPQSWLFVIGLPEIDIGLSGKMEDKAFRKLEPPSDHLVGVVSRIVLMKMIPSIIDQDIKSFGEAITSLDYKFGEYWIKVQGGRFRHPVIEKGVEFLLKAGAYGVGQSSWGPAFYGLVKGEKQAKEVSENLEEFFNSCGHRGDAFYTKPDNRGAKIKVIKD